MLTLPRWSGLMAKAKVRGDLEALDVSVRRGPRRRGGWRPRSAQVRPQSPHSPLLCHLAPRAPLASGCGTADNLTCYCLTQHSELVQSGKSTRTNSPFPVFSSYNCAPLMLLVTFPPLTHPLFPCSLLHSFKALKSYVYIG